jgi:predicted phage terminase large subunit-like protein
MRSDERGVAIPIYYITNTVNKIVRIRTLTPLLAQHRLKFKRDSRGTRLLVEQLRDFPNGDHDDGPDALEMALRLTAEGRAQLLDEQDRIEYVYT